MRTRPPRLPHALLAAASGLLLVAAMPPLGFWPAALALVPLFVLTARAADFRAAFAAGFWSGLAFFLPLLLWLPLSLGQPDWFGGFFWVLYPPLLLLLATFWGLTTGLTRAAAGPGRPVLALLPAAWVFTELLRHSGYFAFPWGSLGYLWLDTPVAQLAELGGVSGLSLLTAASAALLAVPFVPGAPGRRPGRAWLAPLLALLLPGGAWMAGLALFPDIPEPQHRALLLQPDLDPFGRLSTPGDDLLTQLELTAAALEGGGELPELVVWPEGSLLGLNPEGMRGEQLRRDIQAAAPGSAFIVGGRGRAPDGSRNRAWLLEDAAVRGVYDKTVLVPFGETWPLLEQFPGLYRTVFRFLGTGLLDNTTPGRDRSPLRVEGAGQGEPASLGVYICYESVFPAVTRDEVRAGAEVLVNITNDAWFAKGNGARQHYDMGRMRAIETRRFVLRSGLDGITGVIDPAGRSVAELPRNTPGTLEARWEPLAGQTFFVRHGGLLLPLLAVWLATGVVWRFVRPARA